MNVPGGSEQVPPARGRNRKRRILTVGAVLLVFLASTLAVGIHSLGLDRLPDVHAMMANPLPSDTLVYDRTGTVLITDLQPGG